MIIIVQLTHSFNGSVIIENQALGRFYIIREGNLLPVPFSLALSLSLSFLRKGFFFQLQLLLSSGFPLSGAFLPVYFPSCSLNCFHSPFNSEKNHHVRVCPHSVPGDRKAHSPQKYQIFCLFCVS